MRLRSIVVIGLLACASCTQCWWDKSLTPEEKAAVRGWQLCHECVNGELQSVLEIARDKPAAMIAWLKQRAAIGLDTAETQHLTVLLRSSWSADSSYAIAHGISIVGMSADSSAGGFTSRTVALARVRSVMALGYVNTPLARAALDSLVAHSPDPALMRAAKYSRDSLPPL